MTIDFDKVFGPSGRYAWPGCLDIARNLIIRAPYAKLSSDCLTENFFDQCLDRYENELLEDYPKEEVYEMKRAAVKEKQELFKDASGWSLNNLVTSAMYYKLLTKKTFFIISDEFLWLFLSFDKPLFDVLRLEGWDKKHQNDLRENFKFKLTLEIGPFAVKTLLWSSDTEKERPWFMCEGFSQHFYSEDVIRCLDLVGIDQTLARWAVDEMFKLHSLAPFLAALSDDRSAVLLGCNDEVEKEETETPKKSSTDPRMIVRSAISFALLFAGVALVTSLPRSRSLPNSKLLAQVSQLVQPAPNTGFANLSFSMTQKRDPVVPQAQHLQSQEVVAESTTKTATTSRLNTFARAIRRVSLKRLSRGARHRHTDRLWREMGAIQNDQSARRSSLINQPTVASLEQPRRKSAIVRFIGDINSELEKVGHRLYCQRIEQTSGWVDGRRICNEGSPQL